MWDLSSRIHELNHFPHDKVDCYVKRDDELGCGISGTKMRKYASLMPFLIEKKITHLIIIAGPQSNNLLAALQMAREFQLKVTAFLIQPRNTLVQGNFKLSRLFLNEDEIVWINRAQWPAVEALAQDYLSSLSEAAFILNEGASVSAAMQGSMSLATDIVKNEKQFGIKFQHVFVDAGSGFSAAALIKGFREIKHHALIHVLLLADTEQIFNTKLNDWIGLNPTNYRCFYPQTAKSFGSINHRIKEEIHRLAKEEGILADPVYSAKLFHESRRYIVEKQLIGNILIIHSGGTLTMSGFEF